MRFIVALALLNLARAKEFSLSVQMPNLKSVPGINELYLCTYVPLPESLDPYYITGFEPLATMSNAHHMLLYACDSPGLLSEDGTQPVWACGHDPTEGQLYPDRAMCAGTTNALLYAWARDAAKIDLPKDVGFKVGGPTSRKHLVVQVHYMHMDHDGDTSGVQVKMTTQAQPLEAGVIILGHVAPIPPHSTIYLESSCRLPPGNIGIHPIGFRTHAHNLGVVLSGYRVSESKDEWSLIGKQTPKLPQTFYPVTDPSMSIKGGEYLAARCTMVSDRDTVTQMGSTNMDEMCNYYIMFHYENGTDVFGPETLGCWSSDPSNWSKTFKNIPEDASEINGVNYVATV